VTSKKDRDSTEESVGRRSVRIAEAIERHVGVERGLDGKARSTRPNRGLVSVGTNVLEADPKTDLFGKIAESIEAGESVIVVGQNGERQVITKVQADKLAAEGKLVVSTSRFGIPSIAEHYQQYAALNGVHLVYGNEVSHAFRSKMQVQLVLTTFYQAYRAGILAVLRLTELGLTDQQVAEEIKQLLTEAETMLNESKRSTSGASGEAPASY
jgi:hypothetical protein